MSFANSNDYLSGRKPVPSPAGGEVFAVRFALAMLTSDLALNNAGAIGLIPPGCVPVDVIVDGTDMDSGAAAMVLQVGVLNAAGTDLSTDAADGGGAWGATTAVNTAFTQRITPTLNNMANVQATQTERKLGVKVATAPTTPVAGTLGVTVLFRPV